MRVACSTSIVRANVIFVCAIDFNEFYVAAYLNNTAAIDPYASQMMMMPYDAGAVGGMESNGELIATDEAPMQHLDFPEHSQTIVDDGVPCAECAAHTSLLVGTPEEQSSQNDDEPISTDSSQGCATSKGDEGDCEEVSIICSSIHN